MWLRAAESADDALPFRGLQGYTNTDNQVFWNVDFWDAHLRDLAREGYTAIVWYGPNNPAAGGSDLGRGRRR